jgi:hypothetical protein
MHVMAQPRSHTLSDYVTSIGSGLTPQPESEGSSMLSPERAAELKERLRKLDSARKRAEAESRDYRLG